MPILLSQNAKHSMQMVSRTECGHDIFCTQLLLPLRESGSHSRGRRRIEIHIVSHCQAFGRSRDPHELKPLFTACNLTPLLELENLSSHADLRTT